MTTGHLTLFTSEQPAGLAKVYSLQNGVLHKETAGHMSLGRYEVKTFSTVQGFVALIADVKTSQAICNSLPKDGLPRAGRITAKSSLLNHPGAITRSKENFDFRANAAGILTVDYDPQPEDKPLTRDELRAAVQAIVPSVTGAGVVWWCSGSSHIFNGDVELQGLRGQRLYILVTDASDIPRVCDVLGARLWLAGFGRIVLSKSGAKLERHLFDSAMSEPARLDFVGGSIAKPPLSQRRGAPVVLSGGGFLDTRLAIPDLSALELAKVEAMKQAAKDGAEVESKAVREAWAVARGDALTTRLVKLGVPVGEAHERASQAARSAAGGVLLGDYSIVLEGGGEVSIGQVLDDRARFHGAICLDPLEPDYLGGKPVAKLYLYGSSPTLHSFAHGGATYRLYRQPARVYLQSGRRAETTNEILERLSAEGDLFMRGGVLVRVDGNRLIPIKRAAGLGYLVGNRLALFKRGNDGRDIPVDLDDQTSNMLLASLGN